MSLNWKWSSAVSVINAEKFYKYYKMSWKPRNQNNIIPFAKGVKNKLDEEAEDR